MNLGTKCFQALACTVVACFVTLIGSSSHALESVLEQIITPPGTSTCRVLVGERSGSFVLQVQLDNEPGGLNDFNWAGGSYYFTGTGEYLDATSRIISESDIENWCNLTDATIISQDGATNGGAGVNTMATDTYMGIVFQATSIADGIRRQYEYALSGATGTVIVNSVSVIAVNEAPVANAGPDPTVASGASVTLAGSGTDGDSDPLT